MVESLTWHEREKFMIYKFTVKDTIEDIIRSLHRSKLEFFIWDMGGMIAFQNIGEDHGIEWHNDIDFNQIDNKTLLHKQYILMMSKNAISWIPRNLRQVLKT